MIRKVGWKYSKLSPTGWEWEYATVCDKCGRTIARITKLTLQEMRSQDRNGLKKGRAVQGLTSRDVCTFCAGPDNLTRWLNEQEFRGFRERA